MAVRASPARTMMRDPVLLLPVVVAAGLGLGHLGLDAHISGMRVAADLALSWTLAAAALAVRDRPRWRRSGLLLAATSIAVLAADLVWATSHALWTFGFLLQGLWVALLVHLVLAFPDGRPWSRVANIAIAGAYVATLGGQLIGALVDPNTRDVLGLARHESVAHTVDRAQEITAIAVALLALVVVVRRLRVLGRPARRAQGALLVSAAATCSTAVCCLGWVIATDSGNSAFGTVFRAVAISVPLSITAGIVWSRLHRPELTELVVELPEGAATGMRERLAKALGDPTLEVVYRLADGRAVEATGQPVSLPEGPDRAVTAVTAGGEEIAALVHDPALLDEPALVESVRATAGLMLENERLAAEVRSQLAEVRASRGRLVSAADSERRRIERDLHDGAQQRLVTLSLALGLEAARADPAAAKVLSCAQDDVEAALVELRELARGIHPALLRDEGLRAAVEALARRAPLPVTVHGNVLGRLPDPIELAAYFVVSEALTNVVKHAAATEASVLLEQHEAALRVTVADDGLGGARFTPDSGLAGLRDRLEALDATLTIDSKPAGGTAVRTTIPCGS